MGKKCGAKNRSGKPCGLPPLKGKKRCKFHGGASTGPKTTAGKNTVRLNAMKHGVYMVGYTELEMAELKSYYENRDRNNLDEELALARIHLRRAWIAAGEAADIDNPADGLQVVEQATSQENVGEVIERRKAAVIKKRPDMWMIVDRCIRTVARVIEAQTRTLDVRDMKDELEEIKTRLPQTGSG